MALTIIEEACAFFDGCHRNTASDRDIQYYIGVLLCANLQQLIELNAPAGPSPNPVMTTEAKKSTKGE